jgi:C-terminal processing protease CtpA/Prc
MRKLRLWLSVLAIASTSLLGSGCGGGGGGGECSQEAQKQFVLDTAEDWYLFQPIPNVNPDDYATADDLLDAITAQARAQGKDRFFSFLTTTAADDQFFGEGQSVAFGVGTELRDDRLFITRVENGDSAYGIAPAPASLAGFHRGDEVLAIGPDPDHLVSVQTLAAQGLVSAAFGPPTVGLQRSFRVQPFDGGDPEIRTMQKALITLDPVPIVIPQDGGDPIGYVALESFITPADRQLRDAFAAFQAQGIHDVIVDLRYNGGGLIDVAQVLASLLAEGHAGDPMFTFQFNAKHSDQNQTVDFGSESDAIAANRIAFIATDATASASELTINSLEPYADVAIIGGQTFGKPVGQSGFEMQPCGILLRLIAFQTVNANGEGGYFNGLPDAQFSGAFCAADDDLLHDRGDPAEDSTGTALSWIMNGTCPASAKAFTKPLFPRSERPTLLQDNQPGSF